MTAEWVSRTGEDGQKKLALESIADELPKPKKGKASAEDEIDEDEEFDDDDFDDGDVTVKTAKRPTTSVPKTSRKS